MRRYRWRLIVAVALFCISALAGLFAARRLGPEQLHAEIEGRLSRVLGTPVRVGSLHVSAGTFVRVDGRQVVAFSGDGTGVPGLRVRRVTGSVDAMSLASGEIALRRMVVDGARLRLTRTGGMHWQPVHRDAGDSAPSPPHPDELLSPLISLETSVRFLLAVPRLATILELRDGAIAFEDPAAPDATALELQDVEGRLIHRRIRGVSELAVTARLVEDGRDRGTIELEGRRERDGKIQISVALKSVQLAASARYVRGLRPQAQLDGTVSGAIVYETPEPGTGRLDVDLVCRNLWSALPGVGRNLDPIRSPRIEVEGRLEITPQQATVESVRVASDDTILRANATVSRPVQAASLAELSLAFQNVEAAQVRHVIGWLPDVEREEAAAVVEPLRSGKLVALLASGRATLDAWQDFVAARTRELPEGFRLEAELSDTVVVVGDDDRLEGLMGRLRWEGQRVEIDDATAYLNGSPLPTLNLTIDGFPNFFAGDPAMRRLRSGAPALSGLGAFWRSLQRKSDRDAAPIHTTVALEISSLDHPMFLWPLRELSTQIETRTNGVHIRATSGTWAGVPIQAEADWSFLPREMLSVKLEARTPDLAPPVPAHPDSWAHGTFEVGAIDSPRWPQRFARGHFRASADGVHLTQLAIGLSPAGLIDARGRLDLSRTESVPFRVSFGLEGGAAPALATVIGLPAAQVEGSIDLSGSFEGSLRPGTSLFSDLTGLLDLRARDGLIRKVAPPVVAIAEASEALDAFDPSDIVRYQRVETLLSFHDGGMYTEAFKLDGPDIGVLAAGHLELARPDKQIDAKVAMFLFRKLDRVLGKIPIFNRLLLGRNDNLVAAAFEMKGSWSEPEVKSILWPQTTGPANVVLQSVPMFVMRGIRALGSFIAPGPGKPSPGPASGS